MAVDINTLSELYFSTDEPVPYKLKCGVEILIYPVKVKDWAMFSNCIDVMRIEKNETNNIDIIKMSYLEFLISLMKNDSIILSKVLTIFKYSLRESLIATHIINNKNNLAVLNKDITNNDEFGNEYNPIKYLISSKDFDDIKKIILFQNIYDYDDRYISPDVKSLYNIYIKATNKNQEDPTLERKKVFVISKTGNSIKELNEMAYRTFNQLYITSIEIDLYYARKMIQASTKYDVKEEIIYPLFEKKKDKYECIFTSTSTLASKGISGTEQLEGL